MPLSNNSLWMREAINALNPASRPSVCWEIPSAKRMWGRLAPRATILRPGRGCGTVAPNRRPMSPSTLRSKWRRACNASPSLCFPRGPPPGRSAGFRRFSASLSHGFIAILGSALPRCPGDTGPFSPSDIPQFPFSTGDSDEDTLSVAPSHEVPSAISQEACIPWARNKTSHTSSLSTPG